MSGRRSRDKGWQQKFLKSLISSTSEELMSKKKPEVTERKIAIDPSPKGNLKGLGQSTMIGTIGLGA